MDADYSVELGADDPVLELPWSDPDGRLRYQDLRRHPETLLLIDEASSYRELAEFLSAVNSPASIFQSAKCDVWFDHELSESEQIYQASIKLACYIDILFWSGEARFDFPTHENLAQRVVQLLERAPQISSSAEFIIRRCHYHHHEDPHQEAARLAVFPSPPSGERAKMAVAEPPLDAAAAIRSGFYFTLYLFGYGDDEQDARRRWGIGLKVVQNALLQVAAEILSANK